MAEDKFRMICTPNPEIVMNAQKDESFMKLLNSADMVTADGVGVVWASKYFGKQLNERVSGYDLAQGIFEKMKDTEHTAYFFGGAEGVAEKAKCEMEKKYPGLKVVGVNNGYFDEEKEIASLINVNFKEESESTYKVISEKLWNELGKSSLKYIASDENITEVWYKGNLEINFNKVNDCISVKIN